MSSFPFVVLVHSLMLLKYVILCLPLALLPSTFPVGDRFSMPFLRITCPKNVIFLFLMICNSLRFTLAIVSSHSFDVFITITNLPWRHILVQNEFFTDCIVPGAGAFEIAVCDALDSFKNTVASRARLGVKVIPALSHGLYYIRIKMKIRLKFLSNRLLCILIQSLSCNVCIEASLTKGKKSCGLIMFFNFTASGKFAN